MSPDINTFLICENLPIMVDVTTEHIEKLARTLHESAGPNGTYEYEEWERK